MAMATRPSSCLLGQLTEWQPGAGRTGNASSNKRLSLVYYLFLLGMKELAIIIMGRRDAKRASVILRHQPAVPAGAFAGESNANR